MNEGHNQTQSDAFGQEENKQRQFKEKNEKVVYEDFSKISDEDLKSRVKSFFGEEIKHVSQSLVNETIMKMLSELSRRNINTFELFSFALPDTATQEEIQSGNSPAAKAYRALFAIYKTSEYENNLIFKKLVNDLENIIGQQPQMIGAVALWDIAKDVMWRRDVPFEGKNGIMQTATFALSFYNNSDYEKELRSQLDFEDIDKYSETAHMLEAIKAFWLNSFNAGYDSTRQASTFYLNFLESLENNASSNYLLSKRAKEIVNLLKKGEGSFSYINVIENEVDNAPFELSKDIYAYASPYKTGPDSSLKIVPKENVGSMLENVKELKKVTEEMSKGINYSLNRKKAYDMHVGIDSNASIPIEDLLGEIESLSDEERDEMLFDYEYMLSKPIRRIIHDDFNVELKDLTIREQFYFLNYLKKTTNANAKSLAEFVSSHSVNGIRSFLSLERGDESLGDKIVAFGERSSVADNVFTYYSELLDSADNAEALVNKMAYCKLDGCGDVVAQVRENILNRAQKDLEKALSTESEEEIEELVKKYVVHAKEYVAILQEVSIGNVESIHSSELSGDEKEQMETLLESNYDAIYKEDIYDEFKSVVKDSLKKGFNNPNSVFNLLKDSDDVVSFCRFDMLTDFEGREVTYFGSFNTKPEYSGLGEVMLERGVAKRLEDKRPMMGHCDPEQRISMKYIENGFVATGFYEFANLPAFEIWRSLDTKERFESKQIDKNELVKMVGIQNKSFTVREKNDNEEYKELEDGYVLTRYFEENGKKYLVFEKPADAVKKAFTPPKTKEE